MLDTRREVVAAATTHARREKVFVVELAIITRMEGGCRPAAATHGMSGLIPTEGVMDGMDAAGEDGPKASQRRPTTKKWQLQPRIQHAQHEARQRRNPNNNNKRQ